MYGLSSKAIGGCWRSPMLIMSDSVLLPRSPACSWFTDTLDLCLSCPMAVSMLTSPSMNAALQESPAKSASILDLTCTNTSPACLCSGAGDLARWLPDGNIEFLGRIDSQVGPSMTADCMANICRTGTARAAGIPANVCELVCCCHAETKWSLRPAA